MKSIKLLSFLMLAMTLTFMSCDEDEEDDGPGTIVEVAQDTDQLSTLVSALEAADLVSVLNSEVNEFTVFAPTNAAFDRFLSANGFASLDDIPANTLQQVLLNHVVAGENRSTGLTTGYVDTQASFDGNSAINMFINTDGGVTLNGGSSVTTPDVETSNGVVHIVDEVIGLPTVVTFATADPTFSTLVAALTRSDLGVDYVGLLSGDGPFTVFAPTGEAFGDLLEELGAGGLADIDAATLNAVLQYHVVNGANVRAAALSSGMSVETFAGGMFTIDLTNGPQIIDNRDRTTDIIVTDVQAANGVVHAVNRVLLP